MAEMWKPQPIEVYISWVSAILEEASDNLNNWESNFVSDIEIRLKKGYQLTEAQANSLERIYAEKTS